MRVTSIQKVNKFSAKHATARNSLQAWLKLAEQCGASDLQSLKETFGTVDYVQPKQYVFNVGGNKYRVVASINFGLQSMSILHVLTHEEYDEWSWNNRKGK